MRNMRERAQGLERPGPCPMAYFHFEQEAQILRARLDEVRLTEESPLGSPSGKCRIILAEPFCENS